MSNGWTEFEALGAGVAATWLAGRKLELIGWIDHTGPVTFDHIKAAIEKAEPGGFQMALVKASLDKILDGLDDEAKQALPTTASALIDTFIASLSIVAKG